MGRYGLRIFHSHIPRTNPCKDIWATVSALDYLNSPAIETAVFSPNEPIEAVYEDFTGWKCGRCALITETTGHTTFRNIKAVDCKQSGIEITRPGYAKEEQGKV